MKENKIRLSIYGYASCVLILLIYTYLFFSKNDMLLICVFSFSLLAGLLLLRFRIKKLLINNIIAISLVLLFLYGIFNSIIEIALYGEISYNVYLATLIYGTSIPALVLGTIFYTPSSYDAIYVKYLQQNYNFQRIEYKSFLISCLLFLLLFQSIYLAEQGILFKPNLLKDVDRIDIFKEMNQSFVLVGYLINGIFLFFIFYYKTLAIYLKIIIISFLFYFMLMHLSLGNRRDFTPLIIALFWVWVNINSIKISLKKIIVLLVVIFSSIFLGTLRAFPAAGINDFPRLMLITLNSNEFVYPFYTLSSSAAKYLSGTLTYLYGWSYFIFPLLIFIPRVLYPNKPFSAAADFVAEQGGGMGYAYSPVTDAFNNFGLVGPFIVFFLIGIILSKFQYFKDQRYIFIFFTMLPDFYRSEMSSTVYQYVFFSMFLIIIPNLMKSRPIIT